MLSLASRKNIAEIALSLQEEKNISKIINALSEIAIMYNACEKPELIKDEPGVRCMIERLAELTSYYGPAEASTSTISTINLSLGYGECHALTTMSKSNLDSLRETKKNHGPIIAIKELRSLYNVSLRFAKDIIDHIDDVLK